MSNPITSALQYFSTPNSSYETTTDGYLKASIYGVPIFTYTLIAITTITLAYVTLADDSDSDSDTNIPESMYSPSYSKPDYVGGKTHTKRSKQNRKTHRK